MERYGDLLQNHDGRIADAALELTNVSPVQSDLEGERLLGEAGLLAQSLQIKADAAPHIHAGKGAALQPILLQTMSLIFHWTVPGRRAITVNDAETGIDEPPGRCGGQASSGQCSREMFPGAPMQEKLKQVEPASIPRPELVPEHVRYIKLGPGGSWASHCIETSEMQFGSPDEPHELCLTGAWDEAKRYLVVTLGWSAGGATDSLRELRDFHQLPANTLWVTFHDGHLWWTLGDYEKGDVQKTDGAHGAVKRNVEGWSNISRLGTPLRIDLLSTRLTKVAGYQRTICNIDDVEYLLRKINDIEEPSVAHGRQALEALIDAASAMVARLHEREFELLADLLLTRLGWGGISALGGPMPDVDSIVLQGATGERGFVQVKSRATQAVLDDYVQRFQNSGLDRMFFICHSPKGALAIAQSDRLHVWTNRDIAEKIVSTGLFEWLMERVR